MAMLITAQNLPAPDDFYQDLIALHRDLSEGESALVNAKLILLLANHIGDPEALAAAMAAAREDVVPDGGGQSTMNADFARDAAAPSP